MECIWHMWIIVFDEFEAPKNTDVTSYVRMEKVFSCKTPKYDLHELRRLDSNMSSIRLYLMDCAKSLNGDRDLGFYSLLSHIRIY